MKRLAAILISVILLIVSLYMPMAAYSGESLSAPAFEENPYYAGKPVDDAVFDSENSSEQTVMTGGYYTEGIRLYRLIKNYLVSRKETFALPVAVTSQLKSKAQALALTENLFIAATEDRFAEGSNDGDYLRWAVSGFGYDAVTFEKNEKGHYCYRIQFRFMYYDTAQQEREVSAAVKAFLRSLKPQQLSDRQCLMAVYRYIADCAQYDGLAAENPSNYPASFTAYGALIGGKCVCQGYCAAFYRICRELGYAVRIVSSDTKKGNHSWILAELVDTCYFADLTWDDERFDSGESGGSRYFLVPLETLQANDSTAGEHILDEKYYDTPYFNSRWRDRFANTAYEKNNAALISNCPVLISFKNGRTVPSVKVISPDGNLLIQGKDYTVSLDKKTHPGVTTLELRGKGRYSGISRRMCVNRRMAAAQHSGKPCAR